MTVHLPPQIERIVNDAVRSGQYRSAEDALSEAIAVWQSRQTAAAEPAERASAALPTQAQAIERARELNPGKAPLVERVRQTEEERQAAIERLKNFGKTHQLSLGGMTIKQLRDEARL